MNLCRTSTITTFSATHNQIQYLPDALCQSTVITKVLSLLLSLSLSLSTLLLIVISLNE